MDEQLDLLPLGTPVSVLLHLEQLVHRVTRLAPDMTPDCCLVLLGELALTGACLDRIEIRLQAEAVAHAKRFSLIA
jgi:hypothetical protein